MSIFCQKSLIYQQNIVKNIKKTRKKCFIFLENDQKYYYTYTCSLCVDKIERKYITDVELYKFLHHNEAPLCVSCHKQKCFIRVGKKGYFFSNKCSSCMGVRF